MKKQIISLYLAAVMLLSHGVCIAQDDWEFNPVVQGIPEPGSYQTQYPLPSQESIRNGNNNHVPVNNTYQEQNQYQDNYNYNNNYNYYNNNDRLHGNVVMVPERTTFNAVLLTPLSSETAKAGDSISMFLGSDFYYGKNLIAQAGSRVNGVVIKSKKGGLGNRNGQIQLKLTNIVTPSGQLIPITASILTNDGSGILKAGTAMDVTKEYTKKAAIGAASGAVLGVVMGALSGGSVGKGAIYGTAVGGGMGLAQPIFERGGNVELPQNAQFDIILDQPITISTNNLY